MTKVSARREADGTCSLSVTDHATGSGTVCAAVSGIVFALAGYLENDEGVEMLEASLESGRASLAWRGGEEAAAAFRMACIGLLQIEMAEPAYISTKISENIFQIGA